MKKTRFVILLIATLFLTNSCLNYENEKIKEEKIDKSLCVDNEGYQYKTVKIGAQTWMAENLGTNKNKNGDLIQYSVGVKGPIAGFFYSFYVAPEVIPVGWHLPSREEWMELVDYLGGSSDAAAKLGATEDAIWPAPILATNESGFNANPYGYKCSERGNENPGYGMSACFMTSNEKDIFMIFSSFITIESPSFNNIECTIRCIKDK